VIQRFLGHESIQTTQTYLDAGSEAMIKAVKDAETKLLENGIVTPKVDDWRNKNVLQRLKELVKR
jgi:integrase